MTPAFTPEFQLLLTLVRQGLGVAAEQGVHPAVAWPDFLALVERHRLAPFLHRRAALALAAASPPGVVNAIKSSALATIQRSLRQTADQIAVTARLEAAGLEVATVKGLVLAHQHHGGIGGRHVGDIDLVVRPADVVAADALIQSGGLRRSRPDFPLTPRQTAAHLRLKPEYEYVRATPPLRLELLWRLEGLPAVDALWPRLVKVEAAGRPWRTLPPDANALYLFQHGARHGWFRLFWLIDVALLMRAAEFDCASVMDHARRHGGLRALWQGAALCEQLLGVVPPPALRPPPPHRRLVAALAAEAVRQMTRPIETHESTAEWFRQARYRARVPDTRRAQLAMLAPHLSSPLNWRTLPLPDRLFFLYTPLSPLLWLWRAARRGDWSR